MLTRKATLIASLTALGALAAGAAGFANASKVTATNNACPGKIVCPLTGELVCRDECPRLDANRADCPGRIECPLTGELVCADRCPAQAEKEATPPTCCAEKAAL